MYSSELHGEGNLKLNLMFYQPLGIDLAAQSKSSLNALGLVPKIVMPFLVMKVPSTPNGRTATRIAPSEVATSSGCRLQRMKYGMSRVEACVVSPQTELGHV